MAGILFGDVSPSGKLPLTFYENTDKLPDFTDYSMNERTYRYAVDNVLYPFGYGLTYGNVICTDLKYADGVASVTLENKGERTDDVVQLYMKDYCGQAVRNVSLCGFRRVSIDRGERMTVNIPVPERAFTAVDEDGTRRVFGSHYTLYAGTHQPDKLSKALTGTDCVSVDIDV